ncbi:Uncharacterised protein [Mycobacteroides abscessus subsp. abscessus]|nr:Uncharacterised protein [Mycobacteroides abscessus subsp. abscessus]
MSAVARSASKCRVCASESQRGRTPKVGPSADITVRRPVRSSRSPPSIADVARMPEISSGSVRNALVAETKESSPASSGRCPCTNRNHTSSKVLVRARSTAENSR